MAKITRLASLTTPRTKKTSMSYDGGITTQQWAYDDAHNVRYRVTVNNETQIFYYDIRNHRYANLVEQFGTTTLLTGAILVTTLSAG